MTKLAMKEAQLINHEDVKTVSQINNVVEITKDVAIAPFGTLKIKGVIKAPNHYKHVNVMMDDLPDEQHCKDVAAVHHIQILRPGSNKIPIGLQNISCQTERIRKGTEMAHVMAGNVMPPIVAPQLDENVPRKAAGKTPKSDLLRNLPKENSNRLQKCFESLNVDGIESWTEQQQQSIRNLLTKYQHLFAMNLCELGKTSLVQHDITLDNPTPFKECYQGIPPHQYEVKKYLQEIIEIGAICRSTNPWVTPIILVCKKDGGLQFVSILGTLTTE